jgi:putative flippase GtrA
MLTFIKAQTVFIAASFADYAVTIFAVELIHAPYLAGNLSGNMVGAFSQFMLCRHWAFHAAAKPVHGQLIKFILVYAGDLALSAAGVYFFAHCLGLHYIFSKLITSACLGLSYNYLLQKQFVFRSASS